MKITEAPDLKEKEITSPKTSHSSEDRTLINGSPKVEVEIEVNEEKEREREDGWWKKVVDLEEIKKQVLYALPMIITNVSYYLIPVVALMFAGHLGDLELAGSNLAHSWATVTGYAFMIGQSGALETLCGQGYGAKLYRMMGIYLQASCLISLLCSVFISISWLFLESILILLHQDLQISKAAALYLRYLIPALFAFGFLQNMLRFLQTQSVVVPLVFCSVLSLVAHIGITYVLVHLTPLGFKGSALAVSISLWIAVVMLAGYIRISKKLKHTWNGFLVVESLNQVFITLRLALPSAAMVCLEYSAFELLIFLAGLMPNPVITTPLIAMCVNTGAIAYMITYSLSASASTRVSNELGAGNPGRAKHAFRVSVMLSLFLGLIVVSALACGHKIWAGFFSDSSTIIKKFASLSHFLTISIILDSIQGVLSGVARGCGWQHLAVYINLGTFYCIGTPISIFLGFKRKLYAEGLWLGLVCGLSCQAISLLLLTQCSKWNRIELSANTNKESHELPNSALSNEDNPV